MSRRPAAGFAVVLMLVFAVAVLRTAPHRWNVVLLVVEEAASPSQGFAARGDAGPLASPRLARAAAAGQRYPLAAPELSRVALVARFEERLTRGLAAGPWLQLGGGAIDDALQAALDAGPARDRPRLVIARASPANAEALDNDFGRLVDGLAAPLPHARTVVVVVSAQPPQVIAIAPRALPAIESSHPDAVADALLEVLGQR